MALALVALLICSVSCTAQARRHVLGVKHTESTADVVERVHSSIVQVLADYSYKVSIDVAPNFPFESVSRSFSGTGFIVDSEGRIATALHVVDSEQFLNQESQKLARDHKVMAPGSFKVNLYVDVPAIGGDFGLPPASIRNVSMRYEATLYASNAANDVAVLNCSFNLTLHAPTLIHFRGVPDRPPRTLPIFKTDLPRSGESVSTSGFPGLLLSSGKLEAGPSMTTSAGIVANPLFENEDGQLVYLVDIHANHGNSGGPVFESSDGRIIGFIDRAYESASFSEQRSEDFSGLIAVVPISKVLELLPAAPHT